MSSVDVDAGLQEDAATVIRLVLAEDVELVAEGFRTMLSFDDDLEVLASVRTADDLLAAVQQHKPNVAIVDVRLADHSNGIEAMKRTRELRLPTRWIAVTSHTDDATVLQAVGEGARGFLPKNVRRPELVHAIRMVAEGKGYLHPDITGVLLDRVAPHAREIAGSPLSPREQSVLELLSEGMSTKAIAKKLDLGEETVKTHLSRIYTKLGTRDRTETVAKALRRGLVS